MQTVDHCLCGSRQLSAHFSKWSSRIVECATCGLAFVNPRNISIPRTDGFRSLPGDEQAYESILRNLSTCLIPGRLLDAGCATGRFLLYAKDRGWDPVGVDSSEYAMNFGAERLGLKIILAGSLAEAGLPDSYYDACVLHETLEQQSDPKETLAAAYRLLKPGGVLYLITPNWGGYRSQLRRERWSAIVPARHYYFTFASLKRVLASLGFADVIDLSPPANLTTEIELARTSGTLSLNYRKLKSFRAAALKENGERLSNGRGETLVCWARKPQTRYDPIIAASRETGSRARFEGRLVSGNGPLPEDRRVFLVRGGLKHWVTSVNWLKSQNMSLSEVIQVSSADLDCILEGHPLSPS